MRDDQSDMATADRLTPLAFAAQRGEPAAIEGFLRGAAVEVWPICRHFGRPDAVEDLVQETLTRTMAALPGFRGDASARRWVLAIAWRVCADQVRADRRWDRANEHAVAHPGSHPTIPTDRLEFEELLADIDADRRAAFVVTQVLGLSYDEAATLLGCPVGTIRSRVARARLDLLRLVRSSDGPLDRARRATG